MRGYLRRLWAALWGRPFVPLSMGAPISFRTPVGDVITVEVTSVSFHQDFDGLARLEIEARPPAWRMPKQIPLEMP